MGEPKPQRLQLSRRKGFNLQAASLAANGLSCVIVARPRRWGNPWRIGDQMWCRHKENFRKVETLADAVQAFRQCIDWNPDAKTTLRTEEGYLEIWGGYGPHHRNQKTARAELRGKNLACWCALGAPCHADVLLELANAP